MGRLQKQRWGRRRPDGTSLRRRGVRDESLLVGAVWAEAPKKIQREMLKVIFEAVYVDMLGERLVCVRPYPQFAPLFRMDGMEEMEDGCFYYEEEDEEAGPEG